MVDDSGRVIVLKDARGNLYAVPVESIAQFRVSDEAKAELERRMSEPPDEVSGYAFDTYMQFLSCDGAALPSEPQWNTLTTFQWGVGRGLTSLMP